MAGKFGPRELQLRAQREARSRSVTAPRRVTAPPKHRVTEVDPAPRRVTAPPAGRVAELEAEVSRLEGEVKLLKRTLAETGTQMAKCPDCERRRAADAERARKYRLEKAGA